MKRKPIPSNSVLGKQSLKKKRQIRRYKSGSKLIILLLFTISFLFLSIGLRFSFLNSNFLVQNQSIGKEDWKVYLKNEGQEAFASNLTTEIYDLTNKRLSHEGRSGFRKIAEEVQNIGSFERVRLSQLSASAIVLQIYPRIPKLCVEADQIRLISEDGSVYGSPTNGIPCPGPIVKGIFSSLRHFRFNKDATLMISKEEKESIINAMNLHESLLSSRLTPIHIQYERYRGFMINLRDLSTDILVGMPPFSNQIEKLTKVLARLSTQGDIASRIELDFQGKAFIKLKNI